MLFKQLICGLILGLCSGILVISALESDFTLRELAERNNLYVGAAVYTTHLDNETHAELLGREFNMLTPENEAKACELQAVQGEFNFTRFDRLMDYAEEHDMAVHGHTLVWHQCAPAWLEGDFTREEGIEILRDHIMTVVGHYKGRIPIWDVVNEGIRDNGSGLRESAWRTLVGDDYIALAFQFAHEADPDALLFYNDYGIEGMGAKSDGVYEMISELLEQGVPIHGIGLQAHITLDATAPGRQLSSESLAENMRRFGELGLQVQITEMDVRYNGNASQAILEHQAGDYRRMMEACLDSGYCTAFIVWGVSDNLSWLRYWNNETPTVEPLLFNEDYEPKLAYYALLDLLARRAGEEAILNDEELAKILGEIEVEIEIPEATKSDPAQLAPDSVDGLVYYAPFPVAITLDGNSEDWENVPRVTLDKGTTIPEGNDTFLTFAASADDTNLYLLAEVQDSTLIYGVYEAAAEWYLEDSPEFYLNATGDLEMTSYSDGVAQIAILAANIISPSEPIIGGFNSSTIPVDAIVLETDDGYIVEASVPLQTDVWTIEPGHESILGFNVHLNGASNLDGRDVKFIWSIVDTQDQSWTNPNMFARLVFWDVNEG